MADKFYALKGSQPHQIVHKSTKLRAQESNLLHLNAAFLTIFSAI